MYRVYNHAIARFSLDRFEGLTGDKTCRLKAQAVAHSRASPARIPRYAAEEMLRIPGIAAQLSEDCKRASFGANIIVRGGGHETGDNIACRR